MTPEQKKMLTTLKGHIQYGDVSKVVDITGFSRTYVSKCLSPSKGEFSQKVVDAIISVIKDRMKIERKREKEDKQKLESLKELLGE